MCNKAYIFTSVCCFKMHFKVGLQRVVRHREFRDLYQASRTLCTSNLRSRYVEATCVRYPSLKRGNYSFLTDQHIKFFESVLEPYQVITDENELERYNVDWMRSVRGKKTFSFQHLHV